MQHTSVDNLIVVKEVDGAKNLLDGLGGILFGEFSLLANAVEEFASGGQLGDDVELVLLGEWLTWLRG